MPLNEPELEEEQDSQSVSGFLRFVFVGNYVVSMSRVRSIEVGGNYLTVFLDDKKATARGSLNNLEKRLDPKMFFRVSRNCFINLGHVRIVRMFDPKRMIFTLDNGHEVLASRRNSVRFRREMRL